MARGVDRYCAGLRAAGAFALLVPDIPLEETAAIRAALNAEGLELVLLTTPTTCQTLECRGACVGTWKKCAGEGIPAGTIRPCCKPEDHCVEKSSAYGQCRPIARDIPASWPSGDVLTCIDPPECDPTTIISRLSGLSAGRFAINDDIELDFFDVADLDIADSTCPEECQANEDCFAFDYTADGDCTLFGKNLFSLEGSVSPWFDAEVFLTRCFLPEPLCDPASREVRRINPLRRLDGDPHWMAAEEDWRHFSITDTPPSAVLTAAINACRLQQHRLGGCIGFALEGTPGATGASVTLLYDFIDSGTHVPYRGDLAEDPRVYSIEACL
eukprot:jgi/Ulvmu1/7699/UM039_0003.1